MAVSFECAMLILGQMSGTTPEKAEQWAVAYNCIPPPAPGNLRTDTDFALFLANNYYGPNPCPHSEE